MYFLLPVSGLPVSSSSGDPLAGPEMPVSARSGGALLEWETRLPMGLGKPHFSFAHLHGFVYDLTAVPKHII